MIGSKLELTQVNKFASDNVRFNGLGVLGVAVAGNVSNIDLVMVDDCFLTGGVLRTNNSVFGDYVDVQVFDKDNVFGYGVNVVLNQFITKWYMSSDQQTQFEIGLHYPAKIFAGIYLRLIYHSVGVVNVDATINYALHKAMY